MLYKPKFCCECGEKIERIEWQPWTSRKFCQDCEKPFARKNNFLLAAGAIASLLLGMFLTALVLPSKQTVVVQNKQGVAAPVASPAANTKAQTAPSPNANNAQVAVVATPQAAISSTANPSVAAPPPILQQATEAAYYCGARTQKGTVCTRRVRGGGRCWQHTGKPAAIAQEKLLIQNSN